MFTENSSDQKISQRTTRFCRVRRAVAVAIVIGPLLFAQAAAAANPLDDAAPTSEGMPGGPLVTKLLGWLMWAGLAACGGAVVYGAASWKGWGSASAGRAVEGKTYVIAGAIGALVIGLAPTLISMMFDAGAA